jgi:Ca2+-binding RTX toxin-like protein
MRKLGFLALAGAVSCFMVAGVHPADARGSRATGDELTLSFDTQTWVNSISGTATITGTVDCPAVAQEVTVSLDVRQPDGSDDNYGYGYTSLECDSEQVRWLTTISGDAFEAGAASVEGSASYEIEQADAERSDTTSFVSCTRIGTMEDDDFVGTQKKDKICGLDGDDDFNGRGGDDTLRGGNGDDVARGSDGNDVLFGGYGEDSLMGGAGSDKLSGNQQNDYLNGGTGDDECDGGGGSKDRLRSC